MNGAKTDERNYYAESYIALIEAIIKETASIIKDIKWARCENGKEKTTRCRRNEFSTATYNKRLREYKSSRGKSHE